MTTITSAEVRIRLSSLIADLERIRREAKSLDLRMLAFLVDYAEEEGQAELARLTTTAERRADQAAP